MALFTLAFKLGAEPFFFNKSGDENAKETYANITFWFTILGTIFSLMVIVFIDFFAQILLGDPAYFEGLSIVPIILYANLFLGISYNQAVWYKLTDKTIYGTYFALVAAAITIIFNVLFIPKIGYMASAWATLLAYGSIVVLSYYFGQKYYPVPYQNRKILGYILLSLMISLISFFAFRNHIFVSILLLLLYISFIYWKEKDELQNIFKK